MKTLMVSPWIPDRREDLKRDREIRRGNWRAFSETLRQAGFVILAGAGGCAADGHLAKPAGRDE